MAFARPVDTDGGVWMNSKKTSSTVEYCTVSKKLAEDVLFLIRSLGGRGRIRTKTTNRKLAYRVTPSFPLGVCPFRLSRKANAFIPRTKYLPHRSIRKVKSVGVVDMTCIKVDAADGLFVAKDFIVTHNTPQSLVWAENVVRHTNKPALIVTPLAVSHQFVREAEKFDIDCQRSQDGKPAPNITVTNYERLHYFDPSDFAGMVCDESSILKSFDGSTRKAITEFMRKLPYRLLATATAAPNDYIELGTSSEALGELGYMDMLNRFFKNDQNNSAVGRMYGGVVKWRFKGHAETPFWKWVASWARAIRYPSDLGFDNAKFVLPPITEQAHVVKSILPDGFLFMPEALNLQEQRDERRRTLKERCEKVAELVDHKEPALVWCQLNDEGDLLEKMISGGVQISGKDSDDAKEEKFLGFISGQIRTLITKPKIGAWGLNLQHCAHTTFFPSHSYEQYYQGIRRIYRFGQTRPVQVDVVTTEGESMVMQNLLRKAEAANKMFSTLVKHMGEVLHIERDSLRFNQLEAVPSWL